MTLDGPRVSTVQVVGKECRSLGFLHNDSGGTGGVRESTEERPEHVLEDYEEDGGRGGVTSGVSWKMSVSRIVQRQD